MPNVKISPVFNDAQFTANGQLLAGGKIYTFAANSNTIQRTTYTDNSGKIENSNPIVLDSSGRLQMSIWLIENLSYQLVLTDSANNTIQTYNGIVGLDIPSNAGYYESGVLRDSIFYSNNGEVLADGKIYTYQNNTFSIKVPTYTSNAGSNTHTNPIILSNTGQLPSPIYLQNSKYNLVLTDSNDVILKYYNGSYGELANIVPSPSVDTIFFTPAGNVDTSNNFTLSWTTSNSIGVTWEIEQQSGNIFVPLYNGVGNINGNTGNLVAPNVATTLRGVVTAEGNPGADPLFVGIDTYLNVNAVIPTDPYYANVVLLLHGNGVDGGTTFVDNSQYNRTPVLIDRVTTSNEETLFGQNTIKSLGSRYPGSILNYSSNVAFAQTDNFTLEFWIYPETQFTLAYLFGKDTTTYMNYFGGTISETGYSDTGPNDYFIPENDWTYIAISVVEQPLTPGSPIFRFYVNGVRQTEQIVTTNLPNVPRELGIVNVSGRDDLESFKGYLSEIRYTQGVGRYTTATIPVQSAPWPNN